MPNFHRNETNRTEQLIFTVDPVSSFEYEKVFSTRSKGAADEAVRKLMLAVLEDAIGCLQNFFLKPSRTNETHFRDAEDWIISDEDAPYSFNMVCEGLGIDPAWLRAKLLRWKESRPGNSESLKQTYSSKKEKRKTTQDRTLGEKNRARLKRTAAGHEFA